MAASLLLLILKFPPPPTIPWEVCSIFSLKRLRWEGSESQRQKERECDEEIQTEEETQRHGERQREPKTDDIEREPEREAKASNSELVDIRLGIEYNNLLESPNKSERKVDVFSLN